MIRKIKVKANAMEDADVNYVSLVNRPASRIPFRITKSEDDPEEGKGMLNFNNLFKRDGDETVAKSCTLAAIILKQEHVEHFAPKLKELGLKIDDTVVRDDLVILKQCDFNEEDATLIKLHEMGGLFLNTPESVRKGFEPFPESASFDENMKTTGFLPGMHVATEVLMDTVGNILRVAESPSSARDELGVAFTAYQTHVLAFVDDLPEVAFKIDALDLEGFEAAEDTDVEAKKEDGDAVEPESELSVKGDEVADESDAEAEQTAESGAIESGEENEDSLLTDEEEELAKTLSIEGASITQKEDDEVTAEDDTSEVAKSDEPDIAELLGTIKTELLDAVNAVAADVSSLSSKQDELAAKVDETAVVAEEARKAVKGTIATSSDSGDRIPNESLGTHRSKAVQAAEETWKGTALDTIVGTVESA